MADGAGKRRVDHQVLPVRLKTSYTTGRSGIRAWLTGT